MCEHYECVQALDCKHSITNAGELNAKCYLCRLAPDNENVERDYWKPVNINVKNKQLETEKNNKKFAVRTSKIAARQGRDKKKMRIGWKAVKAEDVAEKSIIKATKNSGRSNRDGDFKAANDLIGLDVKLQSTRVQPEVKLEELNKACDDAVRGGATIGGLVITNKNGVSVTVFRTEDFAKHILSRLI